MSTKPGLHRDTIKSGNLEILDRACWHYDKVHVILISVQSLNYIIHNCKILSCNERC